MRHAEPITSAAGGDHGIHRHDDRRERLPSSRCARSGKGEPLLYLHGTDGLAEWPALLDRLAHAST